MNDILFGNNNKKIIKTLSNNSFKANKMRNVFAVIAIVLTTILFTSLFTVTTSMIASIEESTMRQIGTKFHGGFKNISQEQYDKLITHKSIKESYYTIVFAVAENQELAKRTTEMKYISSELGAKSSFAMPTTGRLPQEDNEIAIDTIVLEKLGITPKLGEAVTLEYSIGKEKRKETFTLVGFWEGDKLLSSSMAWLSKNFVEQQLIGFVPSDEFWGIGNIDVNLNFLNSNDIEGKLEKILSDSGYKKEEIAMGTNWAYMSNNIDLTSILGGIAVILVIIFCGYLMIYNVFYISIAKDIKYYGLLKTIGTTGKQIRLIIRKQALMLCFIGIGLGLFAGYFVGSILTPIILSFLSTNVIKIFINPLAFIAAALFAIFTVIISISKPSKIAAKVSPIEALRSIDGSQKAKKSTKKSNGINIWKMAKCNVFRNKKKAILVSVSLSLSLIILNCAYSMANSFDMNKYINIMIGNDFAIADVSKFNVIIDYTDQETISSEFLSDLSVKNGIEILNNIYFDESFLKEADLSKLPDDVKKAGIDEINLPRINQAIQSQYNLAHIYGFDDETFQKLNIFSGEIDIEKLKSGNYIIASTYDVEGKVNYFKVGDKVKFEKMDGTMKEYEVLATSTIPYHINIQHYHDITPEFILPSEVFLRDIMKKAPMLTTLEVADEYEAEMEEYLINYCKEIDDNMEYRSKKSIAAEYENTKNSFKSVGLILSLLVAFIGVMNFINTVVTSIMSRRREIAMLQSIGMTNKQMRLLLICEGFVYTVLTAIFALLVGSVIGYFGLNLFLGESNFVTLNFTIIPALICLPILAVISIIVPFVSERMVRKNSIVERLREVE